MRVLCDTNIFIHFFNGDVLTATELDKIELSNVLMPSIAAMELFRGMTDKNQMARMKKRLKNFNVINFNENVSKTAISLIEQYRLSHDLKIPDAIIAAMAIEFALPLFTYNIKDFKYIPTIKLY